MPDPTIQFHHADLRGPIKQALLTLSDSTQVYIRISRTGKLQVVGISKDDIPIHTEALGLRILRGTRPRNNHSSQGSQTTKNEEPTAPLAPASVHSSPEKTPPQAETYV